MSDSEDELDRTAEVVSSSDSSSSDPDEGDYKDVDDVAVKLAQMRRAAKEKGIVIHALIHYVPVSHTMSHL